MNCLFCKIVAGEIPAKLVKSGKTYTAFRDINPQAPCHILIIPNSHYSSIEDPELNGEIMAELMLAAREIAKEEKLAEGFRLVINTGNDGGQTVFHLHLHLLGGRSLSWPPG